MRFTKEEYDNIIIPIIIRNAPATRERVSRWSEDEKRLRHQAIWDLMTEGYSSIEVRKELIARWGIAWPTAKTYYDEALSALAEDDDELKEEARAKSKNRLEKILRECTEGRRYKEALVATDQLNKINNLYTQKLEVEAEVMGDMQFNFGGE